MSAPGPGMPTLILSLLTAVCGMPGLPGSAYGRACDQPNEQSNSETPSPEKQSDLNQKCVQLGKRAESDVTGMVPHRVWIWRLDYEKSRLLLDRLRRDLADLHHAEARFEASLSSEQESKVRSHLDSMETLWRHLESDAQSLEAELRNEYPTRWHVARDAFDMQHEIRRWNKLHHQAATRLQLTR